MNPSNSYNPEARRKGIIFAVVASIVLIILVVTVQWIANHGTLQINTDAGQGDITYILTDQKSNKVIEEKKGGGTFKKTVKKSTYQILVKQDAKSYISYTTTRGFLRKQVVTAALQPERARAFIGDNPSNCMHVSGGQLASFPCTGNMREAKLHIPANEKTPTYVVNNPAKMSDVISGLATTAIGDLILTKPTDSDGGEAGGYNIFKIEPGFALKNRRELFDLEIRKSYGIKAFGKGFMIYDSSYTDINYYDGLNATPRKLVAIKPNIPGRPFSLTTKNDTFAVAYADGNIGEIVIQDADNNNVRRLRTTVIYDSMMLCGNSKLCLHTPGKRLEIYDISGSGSPKFEVSFSNINAYTEAADGIEIVDDRSVIHLNTDTLEGSVDYSFGRYGFCGISQTPSGPAICISGNKGRYALLLDQKAESDEIDKKVYDLFSLSEIKNIYVSGKIIFISPNVGNPSFQPSLNTYGYNTAKLNQVNGKIDEAIGKAGIDLGTYKIINTLKPL